MSESSFRKIGIVGTGKMAAGIFQTLRELDCSLVWIARSPEKKEQLAKKFGKKLKRSLKAEVIDEATHQLRLEKTLISDDRHDLADCDLIIETIIEDLEIKSQLFRELDAMVNDRCIFATNTSSIRPDLICPSEARRGRFAAMHFFYPVEYSTILELYGPAGCSPETIERLRQLSKAIGQSPIVLSEKGAFILNKLASYVNNLAVWFYTENVLTHRELDELMKEHLFSMGAFEFADSVGIDTIIASTKVYMEDMEFTEHFPRALATTEALANKGDLGMKTGKGWYSYAAGVEDEPDPPLKAMSAEEREQYKDTVVKKLVCVYINMCFDAVSKGYISEADVEIAMNEYSGVGKGPGRLAGEFGGLPEIHRLLQEFHRESGEEIYRPCAYIEEKVCRD